LAPSKGLEAPFPGQKLRSKAEKATPRANRQFPARSDLARYPATAREDCWSEWIAVGSESFVNRVRDDPALKARHRQLGEENGAYTLREPRQSHDAHFARKNEALRPNNTVPWDANLEITAA
jgi:hypothetical protein